MCKCSFALLLLSMCAWTQTQTPPILTDTPDAVIAVVNGRNITRSEYKKMLDAQDGNLRAMGIEQPKAFLEQYAQFETVLAAAEKAGLDKQSPFKERIAMARRQILVSGFIDDRHKNFSVTPEQVQAQYNKNKDLYRQVMVHVIFISGMTETRTLSDGRVIKAATPDEVKDKAAAAAKAARASADFGAVAKQYSEDPDSAAKGGAFPHPIRPNSNNVPIAFRQALFAGKAGDIVGPLAHETGFYIFKIDSTGQATLDQVRDDIVKEMKDATLKQWLDEFKANSNVTIPDEALLMEAAKAK